MEDGAIGHPGLNAVWPAVVAAQRGQDYVTIQLLCLEDLIAKDQPLTASFVIPKTAVQQVTKS